MAHWSFAVPPSVSVASARWCLAVLLLATPWGPRERSRLSYQGWGPVQVAAQIQKCHAKCKKCHLFDYNLEWHCLECEEGYVLWVDGCIGPCEVGYYRYGYQCLPCTSHCDTCIGSHPHECTKCSPGFEFDFRQLCVRTCPNGYYVDVDGITCKECDSYCKTCIAGSQVSCTTCFEGYSLRVLEEHTQTGECNQDCRVGFFRDAPDDMRCVQCTKYCNNCSSVDMCFGCEEGATLFNNRCYPHVNSTLGGPINFETYLQSGAGIVWDDEDAPNWEILMGINSTSVVDPVSR